MRKRKPKVKPIRVSDHALIRYLERFKGLDREKIEREILTPELLEYISKLGGNGSYPIGDFRVVMK